MPMAHDASNGSSGPDAPHELCGRHRYRVGPLVARGGMGRVHRLHGAPAGRDWVAKIAFAGPAASSACLHREIRALQALKHPQIVQLRDCGEERGIPWFAMDRHPGSTLRAVTRDHFRPFDHRQLQRIDTSEPLPPPSFSHVCGAPAVAEGARPPAAAGHAGQVARLFRGLCEVVGAVHARGWVHGDLTPSNVIVSDVDPILIDFGQAVALGADTPPPAGGTVSYCAPERILGAPPSQAADLFALGAVLYELLTGTGPFEGASAAARVAADPLPASHWVDGLPNAIETALRVLLGRDPLARPAALLDLHAALDAWAPPAPATRDPRWLG